MPSSVACFVLHVPAFRDLDDCKALYKYGILFFPTQVTTSVVPERLAPLPADLIPLWVYVVATMVGVFILCVIVLGLWKVRYKGIGLIK